MFYCYDNDYNLHEGKTLTEVYKKAEKKMAVFEPETLIFIEGNKIKVEFQVVPATQVAAVTKKNTTRK